MALKIIYRQLKTLNIVTAVTRNQVPCANILAHL